ncbi:MAG: hypothetical protein ABJM75_10135 [Luteolibacter sp.]
MNHCLFKRFLPAICLLMTSSFLPAEEPTSAMPGTIEFACVAWEKLSQEELFYRDGEDFHALEITPGQQSEIRSLTGSYALELHILKENGDEEPTYALVGLAPILEGSTRMLFLIEEKTDYHGLPLQLRGMDDSPDKFPVGTTRLVNFTAELLKVALGDDECELEPDAIEVAMTPSPADGGFVPFLIKDEEGNAAFESRLFSQPTERKTVFILPPTDGRSTPTLKFVSEYIATPPTDEGGAEPTDP